ncbi:hypothetical protein Hypma_014701 [Hypsizygus marmoreus]|uniref:DUF7770 domain-containing protein n=1 Tax=Hypsizygus marmoreus TaxID=39966 RepID=A0A369JIE1_HYPMA|nr:hypothetical protein Hypma_014701 [Hypsizygus marmoreus]
MAFATTVDPNMYPNTVLRGMTVANFNQRVVQEVVVAVTPASHYETSNAELNHWRIFFMDASGGSVAFDVVKRSGMDYTSQLTVSSRDYGVSRSSVQVIPLPLGDQPFSAFQAWSVLASQGLLRYRYTQTGEGCRCWVRNAVQTLTNAHYLFYTAPNVLYAYLPLVWKKDGTTEQRVVAEGHYFS